MASVTHMRATATLLVTKFDAGWKFSDASLSGVGRVDAPKGGLLHHIEAGEGCATTRIALVRRSGIAFPRAECAIPDKATTRTTRTIPHRAELPVRLEELRAAIDGLCTCSCWRRPSATSS